jgi:hypothetical protein
MPRYTFHKSSAQTKGGKIHVIFSVAGGELDTSVVDDLTDVTLEHQGGGKYLLVTGGETARERSKRNLNVYFVLVQWFCMDNKKPLDKLVREDKAKKSKP